MGSVLQMRVTGCYVRIVILGGSILRRPNDPSDPGSHPPKGRVPRPRREGVREGRAVFECVVVATYSLVHIAVATERPGHPARRGGRRHGPLTPDRATILRELRLVDSPTGRSNGLEPDANLSAGLLAGAPCRTDGSSSSRIRAARWRGGPCPTAQHRGRDTGRASRWRASPHRPRSMPPAGVVRCWDRTSHAITLARALLTWASA